MGSFAEQRKKNRLTREIEDTPSFREERLRRVNIKEKSKAKMTEEPELRDENMYTHMQNMENLVRVYGNRAKEWTPSVEPEIETVSVKPVRTPLSGFKEQMLIGEQNMERKAAEKKRKTLGQETDGGFLRYDEIHLQPDYQKNVEAGKTSRNIFNSQPDSLLDYLSKDVRINERVRANDSYTYMNETEKDLYSYLVGKYGPKSGADYIESIRPELNQRATEKLMSDKRTQAETNGDAALGDYVHSTLTGYMRAPLAIGKQAYNNVFKGRETLDPNDPVFRSELEKEALREGFKENPSVKKAVPDEGLRSFGVDTGLSMLDTVTRLPMGYLGLGTAAGSAAASGMRDALERGGSGSQALFSGVASGAWEYAAEKAGFDRLKGLKLNPATSAREFIKNIAKQGATEGLEEAVTEIANTASDAVIMQELSQVNLDYERYLASGMGDAEARAQAVKEMVSRVGLAAAGGAVSGGVMGAGAQTLGLGAQELYYRDTGRKVNPDYRDYAESIDISEENYSGAADHEEAMRLQKLAHEYADRQSRGEFISNREKGKYETELDGFVYGLWDKQQEMPEDVIKAEQEPENTAEVQKEPGVPVKMPEQLPEPENHQKQTEIQKEPDVYEPQEHAKSPDAETFEQTVEDSSLITEKGQNEAVIGDENDNLTLAKAWSDVYGNEGKAAFEDMYDGEVSIQSYYKGFNQYYNAGRYGMEEMTADRSASAALLSYEQKTAAYKAGLKDRELESGYDNTSLEPKYLTKGDVKEGGLSYASESATDAQKKMADYMGKKTGLKFELVDETEAPEEIAAYKRKSGVIRIRTDAKNFNAAISHELTHFIQDYSPDNYQFYQETVVQAITEASGTDLETMISKKIDQYRVNGRELSRAEAVDEIVANATESFLNDEEFVKRIINKDRTLGEKIKDFLDDVIEAITSLIKNGSVRAEAKALEENARSLKRAKRMWENGLDAASQRRKEGWEPETKSDQEERYALKAQDQVTPEQIEKNCNYVRDMEPVITLTGNEFTDWNEKRLSDQVMEYYNSIRNVVYNDVVGKVLLNKKSVKNDIAHGVGRLKAVTFRAVPSVIENGKVLSIEKDWKKRGYDSVAIGAKISIKGGTNPGDYFVICMLNVDKDNRLYLHEAKTVKMDDLRSKTRSAIAGGLSGANHPSIDSIFEKLTEVNTEDVRFQLEDVDFGKDSTRMESLVRENEDLKAANELLQKQFELTGAHEIDADSVKRIAEKILERHQSEYNSERLSGNIQRLYHSIWINQNVRTDEVLEVASAIGRSILKKSTYADRGFVEQYRDLKKKVKNTKLSISEMDRSDLERVGGYRGFKKDNAGRMRIGDDGISVDSFYQELKEEYPELFSEEITHPADQLIEIADVLDHIGSQLKNPYHANMDEMSVIVGHEILDEYFDVKRDENPTFADLKEEEIKRIRKQYHKRMGKYKASIDMEYREKLKALNTRYAEKKAELKEKQELEREAMWKRYREKVQSHRDYQQGRHDKQIIIKEANKLRKWLLEPSKDHYIPDPLRVTVAEFLKDIDFSSNRTNEKGEPTRRTLVWEEAAEVFERIINAGGIVKKDGHQEFWHVDPALADKIRELRKEMTALSKYDGEEAYIPKLDDMESYQLAKLKEIVYAVRSALYNANRLNTLEKSQKVNEFASEMYQELDELNEKGGNPISAVPDKMMNYEMLDSLTMFERFGEHGKQLYSSIREGLDRKTVKLRDTEKFIRNTLSDLDVTSDEIKSWERGEEAIKKFRIGTREVTLTTAQIMEIYELSKEEQGQKHLYSKVGGITPGPITTGFKADLKADGKKVELPIYLEQHHVSLTKADVDRITGILTEKQKKLADAMQRYMEKNCGAWGDEVHRKLNGYERFKTKGYYPLKVDSEHTKQNDERPGELTIEHMGLTKQRNQEAGNPLMVNSIFETFSDHVDRMSSYYGYVLALSDARKILNYRDFEMGGSIYEQIKKVFGKNGLDYVNGLFKDINGTINKDRSIMEKAISSMKASAVSGNLRVAVQQPTAYIRAAAEIDPKYLAKGMRSEATKTLWPKICRYAPIAQWKEWGFYQMQTSRQLKDIMFGTESAMQNATDKFMWLTSMGDKATWCRIWTACEYETMDTHPELKKGSEEFYEQVGKRFSDVIDRTQVVDSVLHRPKIMRSSNMLNKMATDFMGEPLKNYNMLYRAASGLSNRKKNVSRKEFWKNSQKEQKQALRVAAVYVAQAIVVSLAASSVDVLRDDDREKDLLEKYKTHVWDNLKSGLNPIGSIPYAKDLLSISQGYKVLRTDMSIYQDLYYSMREMEKLWKGESPRTPAWVVQNSVRAVSKLFGLPVNSVMRDAGALIDTAMNCYGGGADYAWLKGQYELKSKENLTMYVSVLLGAQRAGNKKLAEKIKKELNQAGHNNDDISAKIKSIVKSELVSTDFVHPQIEAAAKAKIDFDTEAYEKAAKALQAEGYEQKTIASAVKTRVGQMTGGEDEPEVKEEIKVPAEDVINEGLGKSEDDEFEGTLYDTSDLVRAIEQVGSTRSSLKGFETVANSIVDSKVAAGEKRSKAVSSLKSSITRKYKEQWLEADNKKRVEIQNKLKYLKVGTKTLYSASDWKQWMEDAKNE